MFQAIGQGWNRADAHTRATLNRWRTQAGWFDHLARAVGRFNDTHAGRLAAALTYTAFLGLFPLLLLAFSVLGFVLDGEPAAMERVAHYLDNNIPTLDAEQIAEARFPAGIIGIIGTLWTGLNWVSAIRGSVRAVWLKEDEAENLVLSKLADLGVMAGLGLLLGASMLATFWLSDGVRWLLSTLGADGRIDMYVHVSGYVIGAAMNMVLVLALLSFVPRFRLAPHRLWFPVLLGGIGIELLKGCAGVLFRAALENPAYALVVSAVGMMLFLNVVNRLLLFCAALTATGVHGTAVDKTTLALAAA
ncbi:MAG: YihY/virulence factor BrkB family protein [Corynebacteriales bacterium]|nr:YihY/virulence factor BrkB family protein [Mycobacteriales bacterium]